MAGVGYRHGVRGVFTELGIFTLPCLYILNCILLAKRNGDHVLHGDIHDYETRQRGQICTGYLRLQSSRYSANYYSKKFYNKMPLSYRSLSLKQLKDKTKTWLLKRSGGSSIKAAGLQPLQSKQIQSKYLSMIVMYDFFVVHAKEAIGSY